MSSLLLDLRYALRQLARRPAFTSVAVLTLALGIGANTAIFSVVGSVLLRPLPYAEEERLVTVWNSLSEVERVALSGPEVLDLRGEVRSFEQLAAYRMAEANLTEVAEAERLAAARVTANLFATLGSAPVLGRTFSADEDVPGGDGVAVLGHGLWQRRFGGDPAVVGRTLQLDGRPRTVVGVMPADFRLPADYGSERPSEIWLPLALTPETAGERGRHHLLAVGRLRPGATAAHADAELGLIARRWVTDGTVADDRFTTFTTSLREEVVGDVRPALLILFGAVGLVLLIACANVASLLLARADERRRELAVRAALGAGSWRIARQLLTESLLLAALGGFLGALLAGVALRLADGLAPTALADRLGGGLDLTVLAFTAVLSLGAGVLFGTAPALIGRGRELATSLRQAARGSSEGGRQGFRGALVVGQVALCVVLLAGAGLLLRSFTELRQVELGFDPDNVLTFQLSLPATDYPGVEPMVSFYEELRRELEALPGVRSAGAAALLPLDQPTGDWGIDIEGRVRDEENRFHGYLQVVTPGYFETMRVPLLRGRTVGAEDRGDAPPAVVINASLAARYWPGADPLGERIRIRGGDEGAWYTVVGVVDDVRHNAIAEEPRHEMYFPHAQLAHALGGTLGAMNLVVRTAGDPLALAGAVRQSVRSRDPNLPVASLRSMAAVVDRELAEPRFTTLLLGIFSLLALLIGAVGIYGVMAFAVARRTREIGIRMALGAGARRVVRTVVTRGLLLVGAGVGIGLATALAATRTLSGLLYGVSASDPLTFAAVPLLLLGVAVFASWLPARRAARVDPVIALRAE